MFFADLPPSPVQAETIVVTASRTAEEQNSSPASVAVLPSATVRQLGQPLLAELVALTPSAALSTTGTAGSQSQVRIRGSEANHTLLFIDGIRANDPAAGNEPRFELLSAELGDRIEVVRGPQSALWGPEAIGGVVALEARPETGAAFLAEAGSLGFRRLSASGGLKEKGLTLGLAAGAQQADGIDSFAGGAGEGDRDGYENRALRGRLDWTGGALTLTASGFLIRAEAEFDGFDPVTFVRADTADENRNRLQAARLGARWESGGWTASLSGSRLSSRNRNLLAGSEQNRTGGSRDTLGLELGRELTAFGATHRLTGAAEWARERFRASDTAFGGFTNQRRRRDHSALVGEWRGEAGPAVATLAVRRDRFSEFKDATTARAGLLLRLGGPWQLAGNYGSGIAQPSFFDLYGFFPSFFRGNPALAPERSRGGEVSLRHAGKSWRGALTLFRQKLTDEIVDRFDPASFLSTVANAEESSRRKGVELELGYTPSELLSLSASYAFLDATEPAGRELRRPRHSGALLASGTAGRFQYGASLAYQGRRLDRDFDVFPSRLVSLSPTWNASARIGWELGRGLELFARTSNALDEDREDVVGYRREGRTIYGGIRARLGG
jgi:vitamin B12 transporter